MPSTPSSAPVSLVLASALAALAALPACSGGGGGSGSGSVSSTQSSVGSSTRGPGSIASDFDAPTVALTSPSRGEYIQGGAGVVTVAGSASDGQGSGIAAFAVNGVPTPLDAQGRFSTQLTLDEGVTIVVARAVDFAGNVATTSLSVMYAQSFRLATDEIPGAVGARVSEASINKLAPVMAQSILSSGVIQSTVTGQPLYHGDVRDPIFNACIASADVSVLSITFGTPTIVFDAIPGGFNANVHVPNLRIDANAHSYCGIGYSVTGNVRSTDVALDVGLDVALLNGQYQVTSRSSTIALNGFQWGINNIPAAITNIVYSMVKDEIEKRLKTALEQTLPNELAQALQSIGQPISRQWNGKTVTFRATPEGLQFDDAGFQVNFGGNVTAARNPAVPLVPGSFFRASPAGQVPDFASGPAGFYATANENLVNRALFTSWQAGFWTIQMDTQFFQQFGVALPFQLDANLIAAFFPPLRAMVTPGSNVPVALRFDPQIQPLMEMTGAPDLARLSLGEMHMSLLMDFGAGFQPIFETAIHIRAGANATFQGNALKFSVSNNVDFEADMISTQVPLMGIDVERFLTFLVPPAIQVATQTMAPIPIPSLSGVNMTNMSLYRDGQRGEFATVSGDVQ